MSLSSGQLLNNRYRIVKLIGQGGFGAVYRAWDTVLNQPCALKENLDPAPVAQRQFQREATILASLRHMSLPRVIDHFVYGQGQYLVMDFVDGQSLADLLAQHGRPFTEAEVVPWLIQVCDALDYLHRQVPPIIHRDIKPQNIIITPTGQAVLVDFGIAKVFDPATSTSTGAQGVTSGYSPPEQYGTGRTDARSDIYAVGATLYTLLTGQTPPDAVTRLAQGTPLSPRRAQPGISPGGERVIAKAMDLRTDARYQAIWEVRLALAGLQPTQTIGVIPGGLTRLPVRWRWGLSVTALLTLFLLLTPVVIPPPTSSPTPTSTRVATATSTATSLPTGTWTSSPSWMPSATATGTIRPSPTFTPTPSATTTGTPTVTPEPSFSVSVSAANVRTGPGTMYPVLGDLKLGGNYVVIGRNAAGTWWQFLYNGQPAWISSDLVIVSPSIAIPVVPDPSTPTPGAGSARISTKDGMVQAYVPSGTFLMGSPDGQGRANERPQHEIYLDAYWMDRTEISNSMFARFAQATNYRTDAERMGWGFVWTGRNWERTNGTNWRHPGGPSSSIVGLDEHPVVQVSWNDAQTYCQWAGRMLPTEAQWEKAARSGDARIYPWGNVFECNRGNFQGSECDGFGQTAPVGSFANNASVYGVLQMAGNAWEWVADFYREDYYAVSPSRNPSGPSSGSYRVMRGGSWSYGESDVRVARRDMVGADHHGGDTGFRCVQYP